MTQNEKFLQFIKKYPHRHKNFFDRPYASRRSFLGLAGGAVTLSWMPQLASAQVRVDKLNVPLLNKAKNTIFILLTGAPSHTDTFDLKMVNGVTPSALFKPETVGGMLLPTGIMPKLSTMTSDFAVIRSMRSWALVHNLAQIWTQIGRNPAAALGDIAPNIGSIVAIEKEAERKPTDVLPTFIALNSTQGVGSGYLSSSYAPLKTNATTTGLRNVTNPDGQARFNERYDLVNKLDAPNRSNSPYGKPLEDMDAFYKSARGMVYNPVVDGAFQFTAAERIPYGSSALGDSCLNAVKILKANAGTRFIQITTGGWDDHTNIYTETVLPNRVKSLDAAVGQLIADLKANGLFNDTLIVMAGEFGRTVGQLSAAQGRDHYVQQFAFLAGAGIKGGRAIGSTNSLGSATSDFGWSRQRDVRPEDIEATIYSAMGINYTSIRYDDPFNRGFEYVPFGQEDLYGPVKELWA
ncbi:MAG: DUF1501 domain-containing protein [Acidobacteria bacterium]|nr:DUF1501 domain-containing protein [Acidobacteriota bacterium]